MSYVNELVRRLLKQVAGQDIYSQDTSYSQINFRKLLWIALRIDWFLSETKGYPKLLLKKKKKSFELDKKKRFV